MNKKRNKRLKNLITICALFAVILSVGTYAWFIGMKTVRVSPFEIEIATTEGLFLSMDGNDWYYNLNPGTANEYDDNTNVWAEEGLIPMSTIGVADDSSSRMKLYEKGSLTATGGGYRLLTSRVDNYKETSTGSGVLNNGKGYVAFDLFIKNLSGEEYYADNNVANEEAIYLNIDSQVITAPNGGVPGTGIENSVRVAFMQVGRVEANTEDVDTITGIDCSGTNSAVTKICRDATIWEPNDTAHVANATSWFNTSCKTRKAEGADVNKKESYNSATCDAITSTTPTYAVNKVIGITDNVDVYDGLNGYTANSVDNAGYIASSNKDTLKLVAIDTFTDTEKVKAGMDRPEFMTLAPNSITKVRVYIYIEGQDVDNYDFAQLGEKIQVKFGFTKERFTEDDVSHSGPSTNITPTTEDIVHTTGA